MFVVFASLKIRITYNLMLFTHIKHQFSPIHELLMSDKAAGQWLAIQDRFAHIYILFSLSLHFDDEIFSIFQV